MPVIEQPHQRSSSVTRGRAAAPEFPRPRLPEQTRAWNQDTPFGALPIVVSTRGLRLIRLDHRLEARAEAQSIGLDDLSPEPYQPVVEQLNEYFAGRRHRFDLALDLSGLTDFTRRVLTALAEISFGQVTSYGELARLAGSPKASRAVGRAMAQNRLPIVLPCHRVLDSSGRLNGFAGGLPMKQALLEHEGASGWRL